MTHKTLGEWMRAKNLKDADVAEMVTGLSRSQVCRIRIGRSRPAPDTARKLEELTRIPAGRFVMGEAAEPMVAE